MENLLEEIKGKIEPLKVELEQKQELFAKSWKELQEASEEVKGDLQEKFDELSSEIDSMKSQLDSLYRDYIRLQPLDFKFDVDSVEEVNITKLEELFNNLETKSKVETPKMKKTPGKYIADFFKSAGIKSEDDFESFFSGRSPLTFAFQLSEDDDSVNEEVKSLESIKSLYVNGGTTLISGGNPVPGFQGYGCTVYELPDECQMMLSPRNFTDCLTVETLPYGHTIRYDYLVSRTDNAAGVLETIYNPYPTVVQDGIKPEGTFTYATANVKVVKIAERVTVSDEALEDHCRVAERIDTFLNTSLIKERDRQLIAGNGTNGQMVGLLTQPGTVSIDSDDLVEGVSVPNTWDRLFLAKQQLEQSEANAKVDCVFVNPADYSTVFLTKNDNGDYLFPQNCDDSGRVNCLTLKTSPDIPIGTAIMGEFANNWIWYTKKGLEIKIGMTGDQFIRNVKTIIGEFRGAVLLKCPDKIAIVTNITGSTVSPSS